MFRKLASIQEIETIIELPMFDNLVLVTVLGWQSLAKKNEFQVGEKIIYIECDALLPERPEFAFMERYGYRVKTIKMKGIVSQGLVFPMTILSEDAVLKYEIGDEVTEELGIKLYAPPQEQKQGFAKCRNWPVFIPKTDEPNIKSYPKLLEELSGLHYYVSIKMDGSSSTYYVKNTEEGLHFGVCSRNIETDVEKEDPSNVFIRIAKKYNLEEKLSEYYHKHGIELAIQGEVCGPGMNGSGVYTNPAGFLELTLRIFNVYSISSKKYLSVYECREVLEEMGLWQEFVEIIYQGDKKQTLAEWMDEISTLKYQSNRPIEGVVIRPIEEMTSTVLRNRFSFKIISNAYLLSEK